MSQEYNILLRKLGSGSVVDFLNDLDDVNAPSPSDLEVLTYDDGSGEWIARPIDTVALADLTNVTITTPADGEVLTYESGSGDWINEEPSLQMSEGEIDLTDTVLRNSDKTLTINLDRADYEFGMMAFYTPQTNRMSSFINFTTVLNDAIARSAGKKTYTVYGYYFDDWYVKGWRYEDDAKLSDATYWGTSGYRITIKSCQIVGNTIELVFSNAYASIDVNVTVRGRYRVFKR